MARLGALLLSLTSLSIVGCACEPGTPACRSAADCAAGQACVDRRCVVPADGGADGGRDAALPPSDAPPRDSPPTDAVCAAVEAAAVEIRRPIDAIVLPDESGSMGPARDSVAMAMETTFRTTMEAAGIDYHVIWHGTTPLPMLEATGRVTRNPVLLGSGDDFMFRPVLDTYAAWRPALRDDALKVFVHFTDAQSGEGATITGYSGTFDEVLVALEPAVWGTAGSYRFVYHAFVGLPENVPAETPYEPSDPLVSGTCSGSFGNPATLQEMARRTGGLRFPLCRFDLFDAVFRRIADSAIERASVACELELPEAPPGMTIDLATLAVRYASGATSEVLLRVTDAASCTDAGFLLEADRVVLCPAACARVEADPSAVLTLLTGCDPELY
jgi:hypothetical protein